MKLTEQQLKAKQEREQLKHQKQQVDDLETKARYWRAQWEIRFYTLESEKLQADYDNYLEAQKKLQEKALEEFRKQMEEMTKKIEEDSLKVDSEGSVIEATLKTV